MSGTSAHTSSQATLSHAALQVDPHSGLGAGRTIAVRCRQVIKSYGSGDNIVRALRGIDLDIAEGELIMLVGPSGCGKTTLISVIAGVLDRVGGECQVFGQDYDNLSARERANFRAQNIGFVFQSFNLIPTLSIAENVSVPLLIRGEKRLYQDAAAPQQRIMRAALYEQGADAHLPGLLAAFDIHTSADMTAVGHLAATWLADDIARCGIGINAGARKPYAAPVWKP